MPGPWDKYGQSGMPAGAVPIGGPDPLAPYKLQQEKGQAAAAPYAAPKAQADAQIAQANAGTAGAVAQAEAAKAQADAEKAKFELQKLQTEQAKVDPKSGAYAALQAQIDRVSELYRLNLQGGMPNALNGIIPDAMQSQVGAFDSAAQGLVNPFMAAFKVPGAGSQSDTELRQFLAANTPEQGDSDAVIEEKLRTIQTRLSAEVPPQKTDKTSPLVAGSESPDKVALSHGYRDEVDPILKGITGRLGKMVSSGASDATVMEFLKKNGVDPANTNIQGVLQFRKSPDYKAWQRANPGKPYPIGSDFYTNQVPLTPAQNLGNEAAQSAPGAFAINYAQGVTGNRLDNMAGALGGNPEAINTGVQLSRTDSPRASFFGDLGGQATAQYLMGRVPGLRALPGSSMGRMGEDALYGAYAGSGDEDVGAGQGALINMLGGKLARGVGRAGKVAAKGVEAGSSLRYLNEAGVPLTIGQIGRGTESQLGNIVGGTEERFLGLPIADSIIGSARRRGDQGFNAAAFREMGGSGLTGSAGVTEGRGIVDKAYSFLDGTNLPLDAQFAKSQAGVRAGLPDLPAFGKEVGLSLNGIDRASRGGALPGREWQSAISDIRGDRSSIAGQPYARKAVNALGDVEGNLMDLAGRQGGPDAIPNLVNANTVNKQFHTLVSALDNGPAQRADELFSASRLNDASRAGARNYGGQVASMEGKRPFYDLTTAGMDAMPNLTPDSGTAGRSLFYAALPSILGGSAGAAYGGLSDDATAGQGAGAGAKVGAAGTVIPTLAMMALYSKGGQRGLQKALLGPRPKILEDTIKKIESNFFGKRLNKRSVGMFGSALARDAFLYPELSGQ